MATVMLGYPGHWISGQLYNDCGMPAHIYPFPVDALGRGPCDPNDAVGFVCWCGWEECTGLYDHLGFPMEPLAWWNRRAQ